MKLVLKSLVDNNSAFIQVAVWPRNSITHWGRVTHICVSKIIVIGSDNGLWPGRHQAIIWTNAGILLIGPLGINFSEILIKTNIFSFKKMHLKMSSAKWRPFCLGLSVIRCNLCEKMNPSITKKPTGYWLPNLSQKLFDNDNDDIDDDNNNDGIIIMLAIICENYIDSYCWDMQLTYRTCNLNIFAGPRACMAFKVFTDMLSLTPGRFDWNYWEVIFEII